MPDSKTTEAERPLQSKFSFLAPLLLILLPVSVIAAADFGLPHLRALPRSASIEVHFEPIQVPSDVAGPLKPVGAWQLNSEDRRLAGVSALAVSPGHLLALTDFGIAARLPRPGQGSAALVRPLPAGPGNPHYKKNRDSEALVRDPAGRGWWVAFERRDQLWLYDRAFTRALRRLRVRRSNWGVNSGIEGLMATDDALLLVPENGAALFRLDSAGIRRLPIRGAHARLSDAALLPGGRVIAVERRFGWRGFLNALLVLQPDRRGFTISRRVPLRLSPLDNVEAVAVEPLPGGGRRLWLATDDNGQRPLRTLLLALEAPANWLEGA